MVSALLVSGRMDEDELSSAFIVTTGQLLDVVAAVLGTQIVKRVRAEELDRRAEPLLAGPLRRDRYLAPSSWRSARPEARCSSPTPASAW